MSLRRGLGVGERVGGWTITASAPDLDGVSRARVANDRGEPADLLAVGTEVSREARHRFAERHRALAGHHEPGLAATLEVIEAADAVSVVRQPTEDRTLADAALPLAGSQVAAIGVRMFAAVAGAGGACAGALFPSDIAIDSAGMPVLAPVGLDRPAIPRDLLGHVAPEAYDAAMLGPDAALYGLGATLYRLATGRSPTARRGSDGPPPVPPSHLRHGLPAALDQAIALLMDVDPSARRAALPLLQRAAEPLADLRPLVRARRVGEVRLTQGANVARPRAQVERPGAWVVVPAAAWRGLDASVQSQVAAMARISMAQAHRMTADGLDLIASTHDGANAARRAANILYRDLGVAAEVATSGGVPGWAPFLAGLALATIPAGLAVLLAVFVSIWLGLPMLAIAVAVALLSALSGRWLGATRRRGASAARAQQAQDQHRRERSFGPSMERVWDRIARLREQLGARQDLPEPAQADIRSLLRDLEERLSGVAEAARSAGASLEQIDVAGLRARHSALVRRADPDGGAERARLAETIANIEAVEVDRARILAEVDDVDAALDHVAAALGRTADAAADGFADLARAVQEDAKRPREAQRRALEARMKDKG